FAIEVGKGDDERAAEHEQGEGVIVVGGQWLELEIGRHECPPHDRDRQQRREDAGRRTRHQAGEKDRREERGEIELGAEYREHLLDRRGERNGQQRRDERRRRPRPYSQNHLAHELSSLKSSALGSKVAEEGWWGKHDRDFRQRSKRPEWADR